MHLDFGGGSHEWTEKFGSCPKNSYLLAYWRGEWMEYYASWKDQTSLEFNPATYYFSGSKHTDGAALTLLAIGILYSGTICWPRER
jgi:hypothetical protein